MLIDVIEVINDTLGSSGLSPNQAVFGHGISDVASMLPGKGDHHQNNNVLQGMSTHGPSIQALRLGEVATFETQKAMSELRGRSMLGPTLKMKLVIAWTLIGCELKKMKGVKRGSLDLRSGFISVAQRAALSIWGEYTLYQCVV